MKTSYFFVFSLIFTSLFVGIVSAQYYGGYGGGFFGGTQQVVDSLVQNLEPLLRALFGGYDWTGYLLFEKTLLFILISIIVGLVLQNLPVFKDRTHKGILRLVAIIVGLLGVRNLNYVWIGTILVQYQVLFIAVAGILPFMIYWYFVNSFEDEWLRKISWCFYAVIYLGLWATTELEAYAGVYLWGAIAALIYAFFLDTPLQRWLAAKEAKLGDRARRDAIVASLKKDIDEYHEQWQKGYISEKSAKALIKRKSEVIRSLMKE